MTPKQRAKIYRKSARLIDSVVNLSGFESYPLIESIIDKIFDLPEWKLFLVFNGDDKKINYKTIRQMEVLALLLAAEIAEDGGTQ
jgi:hypothetical protein